MVNQPNRTMATKRRSSLLPSKYAAAITLTVIVSCSVTIVLECSEVKGAIECIEPLLIDENGSNGWWNNITLATSLVKERKEKARTMAEVARDACVGREAALGCALTRTATWGPLFTDYKTNWASDVNLRWRRHYWLSLHFCNIDPISLNTSCSMKTLWRTISNNLAQARNSMIMNTRSAKAWCFNQII